MNRLLPWLGLAVLLVPGCLDSPRSPDSASPPADANPPPAERQLSPIDAPPQFDAPTIVTTIRHGVIPAEEEPLLHGDAEGNLYLATPHVPALFGSRDAGRTFTTLFDSRTHTGDGTDGRTDGALASDRKGTVYWLGLNPVGDSRTLPFQRSTDGGQTWAVPQLLAEGPKLDRQWITSSPEGDLVAAWSDEGLVVASSHNEGQNWTPPQKIAPRGYAGPALAGQARGSFFIALNNYDENFQHGFISVARTFDGGTTWSLVNATPSLFDGALASYGPLSSIVPVVAQDDAGTLYVVYSFDDPALRPYVGKPVVQQSVFLVVSTDEGTTWSPPRRLSEPTHNAVLPWIVAGARGRVAVAWYEDATGLTRVTPSLWYASLTVSSEADQPDGAFFTAFATPLPGHVGGVCNECRQSSRLDHLGLALTQDGVPVVAWGRDGSPDPLDLDVVASRASNIELR